MRAILSEVTEGASGAWWLKIALTARQYCVLGGRKRAHVLAASAPTHGEGASPEPWRRR